MVQQGAVKVQGLGTRESLWRGSCGAQPCLGLCGESGWREEEKRSGLLTRPTQRSPMSTHGRSGEDQDAAFAGSALSARLRETACQGIHDVVQGQPAQGSSAVPRKPAAPCGS